MNKILLALLMALPCLGMAQVATQKVVNTATIYSANSPVTFGANFTGTGTDYLLNNQTLTGNGSIITRILGDARYSPIGGATTNGNFFATGSTNDFDNLIVRGFFRQTGASSVNFLMGATTVSNTFNVVGNSFVQGNLTVSNTGTVLLNVKGNLPFIVLTSTNAVSGTEGIQFSRTTLSTAIIQHSGTNGTGFAEALQNDLVIRANNPGRVTYGLGTAQAFFWDGTTHTFTIGNVVVSNNLTVVGSVTSATNNSSVYRVGGVTGFSGSVTNMESIGFSNIQVFATGILTNVFRIP